MGFKANNLWHASTAREGLDQRCGGTGRLQCHCGGDFCCCGNYGDAECFGCPDCEDLDYSADSWNHPDEGWDYPDDPDSEEYPG